MRKKLREIALFFGNNNGSDGWITQVTLDSRLVHAGSLFFAMQGEKSDGHQFLEEVAIRGAQAAVVSEKYHGKSFGLDLFFVPDVKEALQNLARFVLEERRPLVIGVTGTVGKTTTKEFLGTILSKKFRVARSPHNWNSQIGLPLTVLNWSGEEDILVLEMGMSQKGELSCLAQIASPDIGVLTQVGLAHSAFFKTVDEIAEAKCELFLSKRMRCAFLNQKVERFPAVQSLCVPKIWFGPCALPTSLKELHLLENVGAAVAVAQYLGMSEEEILKGMETISPFTHRGEKIEKNGVLFIDESYNASPIACKASLKSLPDGKRKIGVLGAMKELGRFEERSHREVALCALPVLDQLLCLGKECVCMVDIFKKHGKPAELFEKKEDVVKRLKHIIQRGDVVLVKGSNALALWTVIEDI